MKGPNDRWHSLTIQSNPTVTYGLRLCVITCSSSCPAAEGQVQGFEHFTSLVGT